MLNNMLRGNRNSIRFTPTDEAPMQMDTPQQTRRKPIVLLPPTSTLSTNLQTWLQYIIIEIRSTMPALADRLRNKTTFTQNNKEYQAFDDDDVEIVSKTVEEDITTVHLVATYPSYKRR